MIKKIVTISLASALMIGLSGCSSKEVTIENKQPEKYEVLGKVPQPIYSDTQPEVFGQFESRNFLSVKL